MRNGLKRCAALFMAALSAAAIFLPAARAQTGNQVIPPSASGIRFVSTIAGLACTPGVTSLVELSTNPYTVYYCSATNTWTSMGSGSQGGTTSSPYVPYASGSDTLSNSKLKLTTDVTLGDQMTATVGYSSVMIGSEASGTESGFYAGSLTGELAACFDKSGAPFCGIQSGSNNSVAALGLVGGNPCLGFAGATSGNANLCAAAVAGTPSIFNLPAADPSPGGNVLISAASTGSPAYDQTSWDSNLYDNGTTLSYTGAGGITAPYLSGNATIPIYSGATLLAIEHENAAGIPSLIEIFPSSADKPDEGAAGTAGTVAWAEAQISSGGKIFVHEGSYTVDTTIVQSTQGITLQCANPNTTTFSAANSFNSDLFDLGFAGAQRQGENVYDCGFMGNNANNTTGVEVHMRDTANSVLRNNYFKNAVIGGGVTLDATISGAVQNMLLDNYFVECVEECLIITNAAGNSPTDSLVDGNLIGGSSIGDSTKPWVTYTDIGAVTFVNNHISGPGHTFAANFTSGSQYHSVISNNTFETINQHCVEFNGELTTISNNTFYLCGQTTSNTYADLYILSSSNLTITGNAFDGNSNSKNGIYSDQGTAFNSITGNEFTNHTGFAIAINSAYAGGNIIEGNMYNGNAGGTIQQQNVHYALNGTDQPTAVPLVTTPGSIKFNSIVGVPLASGATPVITTAGTGGAATWTYVIVPKDINGNPAPAGSSGSTTSGNATINGSNYNIITFALVSGAYSYDVYRTASGGTPASLGKIGNVLATATPNGAGGFFLNDTGLSGDGTTAPSVNLSGTTIASNYHGRSTVATDFTDSTSTTLEAITGLTYTLPASQTSVVSFHCELMFDQATAAVVDEFGVGVTGTAPTNLSADGRVFAGTSGAWTASGVLTGLTTTTPTSVVSFTPSAITTVWTASLDGTIEQPSNGTSGVFSVYAYTTTGTDNLIVKRGSYCSLF